MTLHLLMGILQAECNMSMVFYPITPVTEMACQSERGRSNQVSKMQKCNEVLCLFYKIFCNILFLLQSKNDKFGKQECQLQGVEEKGNANILITLL